MTPTLAVLMEFVANPGVAVGLERAVWTRPSQEVLVGTRFGALVHPRHHVALRGQGDVFWRVGTRRGVDAEILGSLGLERSFLAGPVYAEGEAGPRRVLDLGRPLLQGGLGLGVGVPLAGGRRGFLRGEAGVRGPVQGLFVPRLGLAIGFAWGGR